MLQRVNDIKIIEVPTNLLTKTVLVTPELAAQWLQFNVSNRPLREHRVQQYAKAMREGRWKENGQGIGFYENGSLMYGQHRLHGCQRSGVSFVTQVTWNIPLDARNTDDDLVIKNVQDDLRAAGEKNPSRLSPAASLALHYLEATTHNTPTDRRSVVDFTVNNRDLAYWVNKCSVEPVTRYAAPLAALAFLAAHGRRGKVDTFVTAVINGENLVRGNAAHTLRNRMMQNTIGAERGARFRAIAVAWNAYAEGRDLKQIHVPSESDLSPIIGAPPRRGQSRRLRESDSRVLAAFGGRKNTILATRQIVEITRLSGASVHSSIKVLGEIGAVKRVRCGLYKLI